ncbi:hypothetical protein ACIA8O_04465 [Kitasatospora sp. NPDC051853]|uniref:hypothetical protein n=1 Tax=Kitasatospora sp. NPDC051853 TaxID=3364058 RepID=UPI00379E4DBE
MSDDWWVIFLYPALLWLPLGPFVMAAMGVACARHPGWRARLASVLLPLLPVTVVGIMTVFPLDTWHEETKFDDLVVGYLGVYVGLITVLPWLLGYLAVRISRAVKRRRAVRPVPVTAGQGQGQAQEDISPPR